MKCREIALFCGLLLLFALAGAQAGCASKTQPQQTPLPTAKLTPVSNDGGMLFANIRAADQLAPILAARMEAAYGILTTSLVNMDDLNEVPHFGRMLMQQISSRLSQHGFKMIEARLAGSMVINKQGEFMLSREAGARLAKEYNAYAVLVGLYSRVGNQLYISTRVLRLGDSAVLAAYEYSLPEALITPGVPTAASAVPVSTARGVPFSPTAMTPAAPAATTAAPAGALIIPSSMPSAAPKAVQPVAVPVAGAPYSSAGGTAEDALWEQYSKRGQAFADCEQPAAPPRPIADAAATAPKAVYKSTGKQVARPVTKPAAKQAAKPKAKQTAKPKARQPSTMDELLGTTPLCPPGCVPASPVECPPGCVPAGSRNTTSAPGSGQKTASRMSSLGTSPPVAPSPATTGGAAAVTAPVTVTPSTASMPPPAPPAPSIAPTPAAEPARPAPAPVTPAPPTPAPAPVAPSTASTPPPAPPVQSAAPTPAAKPAPPATAPATPAQTATTTADPVEAAPSEASPSEPARNSSAQDGSEPAPAPAAGIPPPAASQLGQFNRNGT